MTAVPLIGTLANSDELRENEIAMLGRIVCDPTAFTVHCEIMFDTSNVKTPLCTVAVASIYVVLLDAWNSTTSLFVIIGSV